MFYAHPIIYGDFTSYMPKPVTFPGDTPANNIYSDNPASGVLSAASTDPYLEALAFPWSSTFLIAAWIFSWSPRSWRGFTGFKSSSSSSNTGIPVGKVTLTMSFSDISTGQTGQRSSMTSLHSLITLQIQYMYVPTSMNVLLKRKLYIRKDGSAYIFSRIPRKLSRP